MPAFARFAAYGALAAAALLAMTICAARGGWHPFGFRAPAGSWWRYGAAAALAGVASSLAIKSVHGSGLDAAMAGISVGTLAAMIVVATVVEELFVRGWMLGFLEPVTDIAVRVLGVAVSARVLTGALFFAAMHLTLAKTSIDPATFSILIAFTILLGVFCGIVREKSGSLLAAIATHLAGNAGGIVGGVLYVLAAGVPPGGVG